MDNIGKDGVAKSGFGQISIGRKKKSVMERNAGIRRKMELWRDKARLKLLGMRERIKANVKRNERKMDVRKAEWEKNLNPVAVSTMPSREYAKSLRNPDNLSTVPLKPKYSGALTTGKRIYGKRFDKLKGEE